GHQLSVPSPSPSRIFRLGPTITPKSGRPDFGRGRDGEGGGSELRVLCKADRAWPRSTHIISPQIIPQPENQAEADGLFAQLVGLQQGNRASGNLRHPHSQVRRKRVPPHVDRRKQFLRALTVGRDPLSVDIEWSQQVRRRTIQPDVMLFALIVELEL